MAIKYLCCAAFLELGILLYPCYHIRRTPTSRKPNARHDFFSHKKRFIYLYNRLESTYNRRLIQQTVNAQFSYSFILFRYCFICEFQLTIILTMIEQIKCPTGKKAKNSIERKKCNFWKTLSSLRITFWRRWFFVRKRPIYI